MAAGTKRKASPPRAELPAPLEIPAKRPPPSTWLTVSPIHCAALQGEHVSIQGITFNRTGNLMAVACEYQSIHCERVRLPETLRRRLYDPHMG